MKVSLTLASLLWLTSETTGFLPGPLPMHGEKILAPRTISHADQTEQAIEAFLKEYFKLDFGFFSKIPTTIKNARNTIITANEQVDAPDGPFNEKNYVPAHYADEYFKEGHEHLMM